MAKLLFGMNQPFYGYVEEAQGQAGSICGRRMYEVMRYWETIILTGMPRNAFAAAWRKQHKWVVSRSLKSISPNATLVGDNLEGAIRSLKDKREGEIEVAGPNLARSLTELGLIDAYRLYLHPVVLGPGKPYFAGRRPPLRLVTNERLDKDVLRLTHGAA